MKTIAVANHKGGVGKTATVHALGEALSIDHGRRVLLVDNDSQASLTGSCGVFDVVLGLAEVMGGAEPGNVALSDILVDVAPHLKLAPSDLALASVEMSLNLRPGRGSVLKDILSTVSDQFDVAIIDCAPNLGLLTLNALAAADAVLIPTQAQAADLRGLRLFLEAVSETQKALNPSLELLGILVTFFNPRLKHHKQAVEEMVTLEMPVLDVKIGRSVRVAEAAGKGQSIVTSDEKNPQAGNYRQLATFVNEWLNGENESVIQKVLSLFKK